MARYGAGALLPDDGSDELVAAFLFIMEGKAARQANEPAESNPYQPGTEQWAKWLEGWREDAVRSK